MSGWIKIHRQFLDHWLCNEHRPLTRREAWENMLLWANYADVDVLIKGQVIKCGRGQLVYSLETWCKRFNWTMGQVRHFFKLLEKDNMVNIEGLKYTTRITICNYDKYQVEQQTDNKLTANCEHSDNKLTTTRKEYKEEKKVKNENNIIPPPLELVVEYCEKRSNNIDPQYFIDWNEARGWMLNGRKMKDWQAAIRTWESKQKQKNNGGQKLKFTEADFK